MKIHRWHVRTALPISLLGQAGRRLFELLIKLRKRALKLLVAVAQLTLIRIVELDRRTQREDVLGAIVAGECLASLLLLRLASHNRMDDLHSGLARDVRNDILKLHVCLHQRSLHVLNVRRRKLNHALATECRLPT